MLHTFEIENEEQYQALRARIDRHEAWRNGRTTINPDEVPADCRVTNDERSAVETWEWLTQKPETYFLYINVTENTATTWMGQRLGHVTFGRPFKDNFGGTRQSITVRGTNGVLYHGTYFKSAGDYARIKAAKRQAA